MIFLRIKVANPKPAAVGGERSTAQWRRFDTVPELAAWEADVGRIICRRLWLDIATLLAFDNDGCWILDALSPCSFLVPSVVLSNWRPSSPFSSDGESLSRGVGANDVVLEVSERSPGILSLFCRASSAASERDMAEGFLRAVLNWNFLGGANVLRIL